MSPDAQLSQNTLTTAKMPPESTDMTKNIITILLDNVAGDSTAGQLIVNIGGYDAPFRRVAFASRSRMAIEVSTPRNVPGAGQVTMVVASRAGTAPWSATSDFNFIDPRYVLTSLEGSPMQFPSSGAQRVRVSVSNLPVGAAGAEDDVTVTFGGVSAQAISVESVIGNVMTVQVTPPAYTLSATDGGMAAVLMKVALRSDPTAFAETRVAFYGAPTFSAQFDGKGTAVILTFDQETGEGASSLSSGCLCALNARYSIRDTPCRKRDFSHTCAAVKR